MNDTLVLPLLGACRAEPSSSSSDPRVAPRAAPRVAPGAAPAAAPESVPSPPWSALLERAEALDVAGLIAYRAYHALGNGHASGPPERGLFARRIAAENLHHAIFFAEAGRAWAALAARGVPCAVLKGAGLARSAYEHPICRSFRDLDLLVPPGAVDAALEALAALGYRIACSARILDAYRRFHFHVPLEGAGKPHFELHWSLTRPDDAYRLSADDLLEGAVHCTGDPSYAIPNPDGQVLHAITSLLRCGFTEFKRLVDIDRIARAPEPPHWPSVVQRARERELEPALRLALELAASQLATPLDVPLGLTAPLGARGRRLEHIGIARFPLREPPSGWSPARHAVRFWLVRRRWEIARAFLMRSDFERACLRALAVPRRVSLLASTKRSVLVAWTVLWNVGLMPPRRHQSDRGGRATQVWISGGR